MVTAKRTMVSILIVAALVLFPVPFYGQGQSGEVAGEAPLPTPLTNQMSATSPPVAQPLVPEGVFAIQLAEALKIGQAQNEAQAEARLSAIGIEPRNGWIADYPVTPDIIGEIEISVAAAAEAKKLEMGKDEALEAVDDLVGRLGLHITAGASSESAHQAATDSQVAEIQSPNSYPKINDSPNSCGAVPAPQVINNYYYYAGPPVVTYYAPPRPYYYLYVWVPHPFRCFRFFFPGFFILRDFHRTIIVNRQVFVVTNHIIDVRTKRAIVIDPLRRRNFGETIGVNRIRSRPIFSSPAAKAGAQVITSLRRERPKSARVISRPGLENAGPAQPPNPSAGQVRPKRRANTPTSFFSTPKRGVTNNSASGSSHIMKAAGQPGTGERRNETQVQRSLPNETRNFNDQRVSQPKNPAFESSPPATREETFSRPTNIGNRNGGNLQRPAVEGGGSFRPPVASSPKSFNPPAIDGRNGNRPAPSTVTTSPRLGQNQFTGPAKGGSPRIR